MKEGKIQTKDGLNLYEVINSIVNPIGNIIFCHGYTEHCRRYDGITDKWNQAGLSVVRYDHRGYGRSEGERAYIDKFDLYVEDLDLMVKKHFLTGVPNFLIGSSMGGLIISKYLMKYGEGKIAGAALMSPALKLDDGISPFLRKISGFLGTYLPRLKTIKLESAALSRDKSVIEEYLNDPLVYTKGAKARTGLEMLRAMTYVQENFHKITLPLLIQHGTDDRLADPQGSKWMMDKVKSSDKTFKEYQGLYHELIREPEKETVVTDLIDWLKDSKRLMMADNGTELA